MSIDGAIRTRSIAIARLAVVLPVLLVLLALSTASTDSAAQGASEALRTEARSQSQSQSTGRTIQSTTADKLRSRNAGNAACWVCSQSERERLQKEDTVSRIASINLWICKAGQRLACDDSANHPCWITPILGTITTTNVVIAESLPKRLVCKQGTNCEPSPLIIVFGAAAIITIMVVAGRSMIAGEVATEIPLLLTRLAGVSAVTLALQAEPGLSGALMSWIGNLAAWAGGAGAELYTRTTGILPSLTDGGTNAQSPCDTITIGAGTPWEKTMSVMTQMVEQVIDIAAMLVGIGLSIIPGLVDIAKTWGTMMMGIWSADLAIIMEILRFVFAATIAGASIALIVRFTFMLVEASLGVAIAVGLSPIIAWLWFWPGMRSGIGFLVGAAAYAALALMTGAITLGIAKMVIGSGMDHWTKTMVNTAHPGYARCLKDAKDGNGETVSALVEDYRLYQCMRSEPKAKSATTGNDKDDKDDKNTDTHDFGTLLEKGKVSQWLPPLIIMVIAVVSLQAILGYAKAAAAELSGYSAPGGLGDELAGQLQGLAGKAMGKMKGRR